MDHGGRVKSLGAQIAHIQTQDLAGAIRDAKLTGLAIKFVYFNPSLCGHSDPPCNRDKVNCQVR
jgi:hypothetical protein